MENEHVLSGLLRKRGELAGQLEDAHQRVRQLIIDVDGLDSTIRLFAPDIDLDLVRPKPLPPRHAAFKGEVSRGVMDILRKAGVPLGATEIARRVMEERGLNVADHRLRLIVLKRVGACLRHLRTRKTLTSESHGRNGLLWSFAAPE